MPRASSRRFPVGRPALLAPILLALLALVLGSCSTLEHARGIDEISQRTLSVRSSAGASRLAIESEYDSAVRDVLAQRGRPEYLHVVDRNMLYLLYTEKDLMVVVERNHRPPGVVRTIERIPSIHLSLLPAKEKQRLLAVHRAESARARRAAQQRAQRTRRAVPAAPAPPGRSLTFSNFDVASIVSSMRRPVSAADPGVNGWRVATLTDGTRGQVGRAGSTEYQVTPGRVTVKARISRQGRSAPANARLGYVRINNAIFGVQAGDVSNRVRPWVDRVAGDPSGSTRMLRRIAGRTVSVTRDPGRGVLVYSVHAQ